MQDAEKPAGDVILRSQQATKYPHLLKISKAGPSLPSRMTGLKAFFRILPGFRRKNTGVR
jgi:hypothetical protein